MPFCSRESAHEKDTTVICTIVNDTSAKSTRENDTSLSNFTSLHVWIFDNE